MVRVQLADRSMSLRHWFRPPGSLLTLYLAGAAIAVVCLGLLGVRLLNQEHAVASQRGRDRLEAAADRAVVFFQRNLGELERLASIEDAALPADTVAVVADRDGVRGQPVGRILFVPVIPPSPQLPPDIFAAGERAEFAGNDPRRAAGIYRALARSPSPPVRAAALVRLGRTLRKTGQHEAALQVYTTLAAMRAVWLEGRPADFIGREGRCSAFEERRDGERLQAEAAALRRDLANGRWMLTRDVWEAAYTEASAWAGEAATGGDLDGPIALARAADAIWRQWLDRASSGHTVLWEAGRPVVAIWESGPERLTAVLAGRDYLEALRNHLDLPAGAQVALSDEDGRPIVGGVSGDRAVRPAVETHLPWTVVASAGHSKHVTAEAQSRRRLLVTGLALITALIVGSSYFTFRGIRRELAVAQQQSDFVSAVSHEFRTPLTSVRQLSHMLLEGRVAGDERRVQYYQALVRESERLDRLVERLLGFGRAECGAGRFRFEPVDAGALVTAVVEDFWHSAAPFTVEVAIPDTPCPLLADRGLLSLALWNLLDNARKYSPACQTIWIDLSRDRKNVSIAVCDHGIGIPRRDRRRIFRKFERGTQQTDGVHGTGIGLALVADVVRAHRGEVRLASEVGRGSTFTIVIPAGDAT